MIIATWCALSFQCGGRIRRKPMCSFTGFFCHRWRVPDAPVLGQDICRFVNLVAVSDSCGIWFGWQRLSWLI